MSLEIYQKLKNLNFFCIHGTHFYRAFQWYIACFGTLSIPSEIEAFTAVKFHSPPTVAENHLIIIPQTCLFYERFSVQEFYSSLFKPMLEERLDFVEKLLKIGSDGVEELLKKVEEKKGNDGTISKTGNYG